MYVLLNIDSRQCRDREKERDSYNILHCTALSYKVTFFSSTSRQHWSKNSILKLSHTILSLMKSRLVARVIEILMSSSERSAVLLYGLVATLFVTCKRVKKNRKDRN